MKFAVTELSIYADYIKLARYTANIPVNEKWNLVTGERKQIPQQSPVTLNEEVVC